MGPHIRALAPHIDGHVSDQPHTVAIGIRLQSVHKIHDKTCAQGVRRKRQGRREKGLGGMTDKRCAGKLCCGVDINTSMTLSAVACLLAPPANSSYQHRCVQPAAAASAP